MLRKRRLIEVSLAVAIIITSVLFVAWLERSVFWQTTMTQAPAPQQVENTPSAETKESIIADVNKKLGKYAVAVTLSPANDSTSFSTWVELTDSKQDVADLKEFASYLKAEFSKYPMDLVKNSGLQTIGIVRDLKVSGTNRPSVPVPSLNSMVYDAPQEVRGGKDYASSGISHEYWHFLDYKIRSDYRYTDPAWSACNPDGFSYGDGGETAYGNPDFTNAFYDREGFVTEYSTYGIEEDRAEMFAWLMYAPGRVKELDDAGIDCKIDRLTSIVRVLSPRMRF